MIENLDYENAKKKLEEKINREPNNTEAIDTLAEILLNLDGLSKHHVERMSAAGACSLS